ncbi:MAG: hypothetical protein WKG00_05595 [Polyangiaceae bacterium]
MDLQSAVFAADHVESTVDLVSWAASFGKRPVVRELPATREVRILRHVRSAYRKVRYARLPAAERKLLAKALTWAHTRADSNVRGALRPRIFGVLDAVGIAPDHLPERVARDKLVEEILDLACLRGFVTLPHLRDAMSRNQLKLEDLDGVYELWSGDPLLQADRRLDLVLDGVYRRGEVYLRALQKVSSLVFGTAVGRALTLFLLLPAGGAFIVLEAAQHLVNPIGTRLGFPAVGLVDVYTMGIGSLLVLGLIHSALLRRGAVRVVRTMASVLMAVFFRIPRWLITSPPVQRFLRSRFFGGLVRRVVVPLALTAAAVRLTPLWGQQPVVAAAGGAAVFAASSLALATRLGSLLEEVLWDWLAPTWRHLGRHVLPGLLTLIAGAFRRFSDLIERGIYTVDELLRFRQGQHWLMLPPKAIGGLMWFFVAYVIRVYFTLLIEPEVNPLKHFPVVTVAHKLFLPFSPGISHLIASALSFLGVFLASTIAWVTVFLLPSVCGFLAWELKENWRLYRQSRNKNLVPSHIGAHGETMHGLLVSGFHSGTVPKLYDRLRHAAQRQDELVSRGRGDDGGEPARNEASLSRFRDGMVAVEDAVRRFVQRELCELLVREKRWSKGPLEVTRVELGSNRIRVGVRCPSVGGGVCELSFEEQSSLLLASIVEPGFVASLEEPARTLFENALAGLYHLAGVDVAREQVEATLGADTPYDISEEGLVIWPGEGYRSEVVYALPHGKQQVTLEPRLRGEPRRSRRVHSTPAPSSSSISPSPGPTGCTRGAAATAAARTRAGWSAACPCCPRGATDEGSLRWNETSGAPVLGSRRSAPSFGRRARYFFAGGLAAGVALGLAAAAAGVALGAPAAGFADGAAAPPAAGAALGAAAAPVAAAAPPLTGAARPAAFTGALPGVAAAAVAVFAAEVSAAAGVAAVLVVGEASLEPEPPRIASATPAASATGLPMRKIFASFCAEPRISSRDLLERMSERQLGEVIAPPPSAALPQAYMRGTTGRTFSSTRYLVPALKAPVCSR